MQENQYVKMMMRSSNATTDRLLRAIAIAGFLWLSLTGVAARRSRTTPFLSHNDGNLHHNSREFDDELVSTIGRGKLHVVAPPKMDANYMVSKRKVPAGPDPIHNRFLPLLQLLLSIYIFYYVCIIFFSKYFQVHFVVSMKEIIFFLPPANPKTQSFFLSWSVLPT